MPLSKVLCRAQSAISAPLVTVEVHLAGGLPGMSIVGMPETAVKESRDRVRAAIQNARFDFPVSRITVSLAPADLPKQGGRYDLSIAIGILAAASQISDKRLDGHVLVGELGLSGQLRPVRGVLPIARACARADQTLIVPIENGPEAALVGDCRVLAARHIGEVCDYLSNGKELLSPPPAVGGGKYSGPDLADVRGQHRARRALEIAAAGGHNLLFYGPPGTGKTMLAARLPGILPPMTDSEAEEAAALASISHEGFQLKTWRRRAFRHPHHSSSAVALVGGGSHPQPGEISLAHHGVLFLDELPEFQRQVLEVLREPLESGHISISRAASRCEFPARFQLVAAMNPCPCGYHGTDAERCRCSPEQVMRYQRKVSGPLLDRIDLHVEVPRMTASELQATATGEASMTVAERVLTARTTQLERQAFPNSALSGGKLDQHAALGNREAALLERAMDRLGLSARAYHRVIRLARTIADLQSAPVIQIAHLTEAIGYRQLDRKRAPTGQAAA